MEKQADAPFLLTPNGDDDSDGLLKTNSRIISGSEYQNKTANATPLRETKLIVMFCPSRKDCGTSYAEKPGIFNGCEWSDCELTGDQGRIPEATVVVIKHQHPYIEWPTVRFPNQTYIHMLEERPCPELWWVAKYDDKINLTWNYRYDADIPLHVSVIEKDNPEKGRYVPRIPLANKTKAVAWAVSHCNAESKRDVYVAELSKYIDVDIYGKCGTLECPQVSSLQCADEWEKQYKFYLAFENGICKDYVTEKLYRTLDREMIPVVLGGADYNVVSPPHSNINVKDYKSPKELASFLHQLGQNEDEYYEYFQWKQRYRFTLTINENCKLCEIAHNMEKWARPAHHKYYQWYMSVCHNNFVDEMRKKGNW